MNPELPTNPREAMELRITALLLGELPEGEAAAVREALAKNPELTKLHDELKATIQLVRSAATKDVESIAVGAAQPKLSEARRKKLLTAFVIPPLKPSQLKTKPLFQFRLVEALAVLAIVAALAAMLFPSAYFASRPSAITALPGRRTEEEMFAFTPMQTLDGSLADGEVNNEVAAALPISSASGVNRSYGVGYGNVSEPSSGQDRRGRQVAVSGQIADPRGNVTFEEGYGRRSETDFKKSLDREQRRRAAGQPLATPAPTVPPPATAQPRLQIALPSLNEADADSLADAGKRQKDQSDGSVVSFASTLDSARGLDRNGHGPSGPAETPVSQKPWTFSSALRGFYDANFNTISKDNELDTFGVEVARSSLGSQTTTGLGIPADVTDTVVGGAFRERYGLARNIAPTTDLSASNPDDQTHTINARPTSVSDERTAASLRDSFVIGAEPKELALGETARTLSDPVVAGDAAFGRFKSDGLERGRADSAEGRSSGIALGTDLAAGRFYRISGGPGGGGGGGGAGRGDAVALSESAEKAPVLGDLPMVGKLFRNEPETAAAQTPEIVANDFSTLNLEAAQGKLSTDKQAWFEANNPGDGSTVNAGTLAFGLPGGEHKEVPADNFYAGDKLAAQGGRAVPEQSALGFEVTDNSAGVAVKPSGGGNIVLPDPAATKGVDELSVGREVVARLSRRSAPDGGVTAGNTPAPVQEARRLSEGETSLQDRNGVVEAGLAEVQQAGANREQHVAQKGNEVAARRGQVVISDPDVAGTAPTPSLGAESSRRYQTELNESKTKLAEMETSVGKSQTVSPGQQKRVESTKVEVRQLQASLDNAKKLDINKSEDSRAYYDKKRELEQLRMSERILGIELAAQGIDHTIPRTSMVEIVDKAQPPPAKKPSLLARLTGKTDSEAVARIRVERETTDALTPSSPARAMLSTDTRGESVTSEAKEILTSYDLAARVAEKLNLTETWGAKKGSGKILTTAEAATMLRQRLEISQSKNPDLFEIKVRDENAEQAARVANAVADEFRERYLELAKRSAVARGQQLNQVPTQVGQLALTEDSDLPTRKPATSAPIPQPEFQTSENSFSTFSLNVSDVSFKLAAASLEKGQMPDPASVRSEEFINAFEYRDPEPTPGTPVAFAWERARYPFAHNRDLLRFSLKTAAAGRQAGRALNVVLLLDNSGSMERADRVHIIREALAVLALQLQPQDKLSVITFARTPRLVADGIAGDKAGEVTEAVSGLTPEGGTNFEEGMNLAYQTARRHYLANGINRVVMLTDGAANLGNVEPESLKQQVEAQRKQGIALDCFGIGWEGFNDDLLETLSRNGDGRYGFINSPEEAATDFVGQLAGALKVAASDVKVQVEFNPKRVTAYRQIGYAKHQLTKEQFRDNTVDAAEIAAQEAGNALYTVEANPAGEGPLCTVRVRYKIPGTTDYREQVWDVPYSGSAAPLEHSSAAMRLAASASAFSEWLVASPFAAEITPDRLLGYLGGVPEVYGADERPKKLEWMIRQAKSIEGK